MTINTIAPQAHTLLPSAVPAESGPGNISTIDRQISGFAPPLTETGQTRLIFELPSLHSSKRNGKIARLPKLERDMVNRMLHMSGAKPKVATPVVPRSDLPS